MHRRKLAGEVKWIARERLSLISYHCPTPSFPAAKIPLSQLLGWSWRFRLVCVSGLCGLQAPLPYCSLTLLYLPLTGT